MTPKINLARTSELVNEKLPELTSEERNRNRREYSEIRFSKKNHPKESSSQVLVTKIPKETICL